MMKRAMCPRITSMEAKLVWRGGAERSSPAPDMDKEFDLLFHFFEEAMRAQIPCTLTPPEHKSIIFLINNLKRTLQWTILQLEPQEFVRRIDVLIAYAHDRYHNLHVRITLRPVGENRNEIAAATRSSYFLITQEGGISLLPVGAS